MSAPDAAHGAAATTLTYVKIGPRGRFTRFECTPDMDRSSLLQALRRDENFAPAMAAPLPDYFVRACACAPKKPPTDVEMAAAAELAGDVTLHDVAEAAPTGYRVYVDVQLPPAAVPAALAPQTPLSSALVTLRDLEALLSRWSLADVTPVSSAGFAENALQILRGTPSGITHVAPLDGGTPALSISEAARLSQVAATEFEAGFVANMAGHLRRLCLPASAQAAPPDPYRLVLVSSVARKWLVQPAPLLRKDLRLRPDLLLTWAPFVKFSDGGEATGELGGYHLQQNGCVAALFEAERGTLSEAHFGRLCGYHMCIQKGACRGMLLGPASFQLYKTVNTSPAMLVKGEWTTPGSAEAIRSFFSGVEEPPLLLLMRAVARSLGVQPVHAGGRCYLGSGACGHAFAVGDPAHPHALKVVVTPEPWSVTSEFALLEFAASRGAPVVRPVPGSLRADIAAERGVTGSGYLLEAVGVPFSVVSPATCASAFRSLAACHKAGVLHGDARVPNLLAVGPQGDPAWIDLRVTPPLGASLETLRACDVRTLARSITTPRDAHAALHGDVDAAIARYRPDDADSVAAVAAAVWAFMSGL